MSCANGQLDLDYELSASTEAPSSSVDLASIARLVDGYDTSRPNKPRLTMKLPTGEIEPSRFAELGRALASGRDDPVAVLARQNRELVDALGRMRLAEELSQRTTRELETILSLVPDVVFTTDGFGEWVYVNSRWPDISHTPAADASGQGWLDAVHVDDRERVREAFFEGIASGESFQTEWRTSDHGDARWKLMRAEPLVDGARIIRWFGTITDVHDARLRQQEAERMASYAKRMVGVVGHDLRAPLSVIMAAANMIEATSAEPTTKKSVDRLKRGASRAARMIDDLLDYTRVELGGGIPIDRAECDLGDQIASLVEQTASAHRDQRFELDVSGDLSGRFDAARIVQAVGNLLENAATHASHAEPVQVRVRGGEDDVRIEVENGGDAFDGTDLSSLFLPFQKSSRRKGLGLGLYIVRQIATGHGGTAELHPGSRGGLRAEIVVPKR
jgi:PAS domain S-box-containing protein